MASSFVKRHLWLISVLYLCDSAFQITHADPTCEPIRIETCRELGYNVTGMPNFVGHELQLDAQLQLQTFTPLIQYGCSSRLRFFLCSVYVPMCTEKVPLLIGPCRSLCEDVRDQCKPVLQEFGFPWPPGLNCTKFPPQNNDKHMCMEGPADSKGQDQRYKSKSRPWRPTAPKPMLSTPRNQVTINKQKNQNYGLCKAFRKSENYYYINRTGRCALHCFADVKFDHDNKNFVDIWMSVLAAFCFVSTLFTLLTFLVDDSPIQYPEGAMVFISCCYNVCSLSYFVRLIAGRQGTSCFIDSQHEVPVLIQEGLENVNCTIVFVMLYFFGMAGALWWVVLIIMWYLSHGLGWSHKVIDHYSTYFHLIVWSIPSGLTIAILVLRLVDADELTGLCYVGNQSPQNLLIFVILPSLLHLLVGLAFLTVGLFKHFKKCRNIPDECAAYYRPQRPDTLTLRIGIFSFLYVFSAASVLASHIYEYSWHDEWIATKAKAYPNVEIFNLKIFMSLVIGFITGLWVWSSKSPITTWQKLCKRISHRKEPIPAYLTMKPQLVALERTKKPLSKTSSETVV